MLDEQQQRAAVVAEARTWLGTPWHHAARVKGAGVDCAMFLAEVYHACGLVPRIEVAAYSPQWHIHRKGERFLERLLEHGREISGPPAPGDCVLWKFFNTFSHGAIVVAWPLVIEARYRVRSGRVEINDAERDLELAIDDDRPRPRRFFTLWGR